MDDEEIDWSKMFGDDGSVTYPEQDWTPSDQGPTQGDIGIGQPGLDDNIDVGGGANPAAGFQPGGMGFWDQLLRAASGAAGGGAGGSGGGSATDFLMKLLTGKGGLGGLELRDLLGAGAGLFGTMNQNKSNEAAVKMIQDAAKDAQNQGRAIADKTSANFVPFIDTGRQANLDLYDMVGKRDLGDRYGTPIAGPGANAFKPVSAYTGGGGFQPLPSYVGGVTLADLAKYRR